MPSDLQYTLDFLRDLKDNNNREWFTANRKAYEKAKDAFHSFIAEVIARFDAVDDLGGVTVEQTTYRINRDVRFSPDKSPYKIAMGAFLGREGRKTTGRGYYIQVQPDDQSLVAGGMYMVFPNQLEEIRRVIAEDSQPLRDILNAPDFKRYFGSMQGEQVKNAPKGYAKDHPDIDLLRYKQFMADHWIPDDRVTAPDLVDHVIEVSKALKPFAAYFSDILEAAGIKPPERTH